MGFVQDLFRRTKMYEQVQDALDIAPFIAPGVEFSIAVRACAPFAKTIITVGVDDAFLIQQGQVASACAYIFTPFQDDGFDTGFQ